MRLAIMGAAGRMGRELIRAIRDNENCEIAGAVERSGSPFVGKDAGEVAGIGPIGVPIVSDALPLFTHIEGVLDFTSPAASLAAAALSAQARIVHVMGTTGFTAADEAQIEAAARHATIVKSGNMSLGVNLLAALVEQAARALDESFDIEILEMHHKHKVDAPSGTALLLGEAAAAGRGISLKDCSIRSRDGHTGERPAGAIGFAALRGGSVTGDHTVIFAGAGERLELTHRAQDRQIFARGAIAAALWGQGRGPGLFSMRDVLGIG
ncbi:MAG: 4-hydroxy-tetrahydrodipicolinate reductase [Rhodomicrobium sp.]|nr:4-hydroxy-tetrahydrodipicolinate reductase [Rhodomicrobium sp.]